MSLNFTSVVSSQFAAPAPHVAFALLKALREGRPSSCHVSTLEHHFPLLDYLHSQDVKLTVVESDTYGVFKYNSASQTVEKNIIVGAFEFTYNETSFTAYHASWTAVHGMQQSLYDLAFEASSEALGIELVTLVSKWANELKGEIWVFESGMWIKSKALFEAIRAAQWDDIVLDHAFREGLRCDTRTFFASQKIYKSLGITWKRGILLLGPPGNGKTESIKSLLHDFDCAALYVKSISTPQGPEDGVRRVFEFARKQAPCILVLEDLDAMVTPKCRSFFLNELDGLAQNEGILTIATTNHPERIDDAILNRPSRFDVKYDFALPSRELREQFALKWFKKIRELGPDTGVEFEKPEDELATTIAAKTDGWSFAFLKELFVSFLLRIAHDRSLAGEAPITATDQVLLDQIDKLSAQILNVSKDEDAAGGGDTEGFSVPTRFMRPTKPFGMVQALPVLRG